MNTYDDLSVYWLRQDLRLTDNPALTKSVESNNVLVIYILDDCLLYTSDAADE